MKIICDTHIFTNTCLNVQRSIPSKAVLPHLECILIETEENNSVKLTGFDLDIAVITSVGVRVEEAGAAVLNAKTFCDILRHCPDSTVTITCNEKNICTITSGEVEYTLISLNPNEYPDLPVLTDETSFRLNCGVLKDMIKKTVFAVSPDDGKTVHRGVKFEIESGEIKLVALDGYRLAIRKEFTDYNGEFIKFVVPAKTLSEVVKLMNNNEDPVTIEVGKRHIIFGVNGYSVISRLLDGEFLNYKAAIPSATKTVINVDTRSLIDSIDRTSLIITDKIKSPVKCIFGDGMIKISSITSLGTANDKLPAKIEGESCTIGFNNKYMLDALKVCDTDEVKIMLNGAISPILIVPTEGDKFVFLILPVRLKNEN